eukprot:3988570-Pyramimonas_sp.AAC.2
MARSGRNCSTFGVLQDSDPHITVPVAALLKSCKLFFDDKFPLRHSLHCQKTVPSFRYQAFDCVPSCILEAQLGSQKI